jgi:hypothetical protein
MKLSLRQHVLLVFEPGKGKRHEVVNAYTPLEAKEKALEQWPGSKVLVIESRGADGIFR